MPTNRKARRVSLAALTLTIAVVGCGSAGALHSARILHPERVTISNFAYQPARLTVAAGSSITFTNHDATAHTATSTRGHFDSGTVPAGQSRTVILRTPGTYTFYCQFHPFMLGEITVVK